MRLDGSDKPMDATSMPRRQRRLAGEGGFTLIEMLIVVFILGVLAATATTKIGDSIDKARVGRATGDLKSIAADIAAQDSLPASLAQVGQGSLRDPWGNAYVYVRLNGGGGRTDMFGVALNTDYDLYSRGKDGSSAGSLGASSSADDIVRAGDGAYTGSASTY